MGYDVTFHPFNRKEFTYFVDEVVKNPTVYEEQIAKLHDDPEEHSYLRENIYNRWAEYKEGVLNGQEFETTLGFAVGSILGYLHPYWYSRGGLLSNLTTAAPFNSLTGNLSNLASEETKSVFDKNHGAIIGNYSSGCYIPYEQLQTLSDELKKDSNKAIIEEHIGESNLESLQNCLQYCLEHQLDLFEVTDLYVPMAGECNTLPSNIRAAYKKNVADFSDSGRKTLIS